MPKRVSSTEAKTVREADKVVASIPADSDLKKSDRKLPKSKDTNNYKKQQFYCERELLAWALALKASTEYGDLSDVFNQAIREYKARIEAD